MLIDQEYIRIYTQLFDQALSEQKQGYFDESALPSYLHRNKLASNLFWSRIRFALSMAEHLPGAKVLDFGCGGGITFLYLKKLNCSVTACEKEFYQLAEHVNVTLDTGVTIKTDLFAINEQFDYIFALDVLEHIDRLDIYLDKLIELCSSQAKIIISGPTENWLYKIGRKISGFSGHYHVRNIYDIEDVMKSRGLTMLNLKRLYFPFTLFRISVWTVGPD